MDRRCYCRKHPSHKLSKGVCPFCLRERLSYVTSSSSSSTINLSNSSTTSLSPISSELDDVFAINKEEEEREKEQLKKSRSLAFVMEEEEEKDKKKNNKKRKFWSKFLAKRKDEGDDKELMHSKTMKEKSSTKWVVFSS